MSPASNSAPLSNNFRPKEASQFLKDEHNIDAAEPTLAKWRTLGGGPKFLKNGSRRVLYPRAELDAWARARLGRLRASTSDVSA